MKRKGLHMLLLAAVAVAGITASAAQADVLVEPTPPLPADAVTTWRRGETRRVYVWAQNNGPEIIDGANWQPIIPANLQGHLTCANSCLANQDYGRPIPSEDFFSGDSMFFAVYGPIGAFSGAVVNAIGGGAQPGHSGHLEYYDLTVGNNTPLGPFDILLNPGGQEFCDPNADCVPITETSNYSFAIKPELGDANLDGVVDPADVGPFVDAILRPAEYTQAHGVAPTDACDMNGDGNADGKDIQAFVDRLINGP